MLLSIVAGIVIAFITKILDFSDLKQLVLSSIDNFKKNKK